jgi:hypothetical protein
MEQAIGKRSRKAIEKTTDSNTSGVKQSKNASSMSKYGGGPPIEHKLLPSVALSLYDKAPQLILSNDQLICYGCEVMTETNLSIFEV